MTATPDFRKVWDAESFDWEDADERIDGRLLSTRARSYLTSFPWCKSILEEYVGIVAAHVAGVFLFKIEPSGADVPEWVWVVSGDLPSLYIGVDQEHRTPARALDGYIGAAEDWISAVRDGQGVDQVAPLELPPDEANAAALEMRLQFLDSEVLPSYEADL